MYRDYGIAQNRLLWFDVHEDKSTSLEGDPRVQNIGIEDSKGKRIVDQKQGLKIWENYVTELYDQTNRTETLEVEPEEKVDTEEKCPYILQGEVGKYIKKMRNRLATEDDDVPRDVLNLLGE